MNIKTFLVFSLVSLASLAQANEIIDLKTEYMKSPLGIDVSQPRFSWRMKGDGYDLLQSAYRIKVAPSVADLRDGKLTYDSDKILSDQSVDVRYAGNALRPKTRYYWNVTVWDDKGNEIVSEPQWFETGLLGTEWNNAKWIGSRNIDLSPYRGRFTIDYDFKLMPSSSIASFILGGKSDSQYVDVTVDTDKKELELARVVNGKREVIEREEIAKVLSDSDKHHVRLDVSGPHSYSIHVEIDGQRIRNSKVDPSAGGNPMWGPPDVYGFNVNTDGVDEPNSNSRLYSIGFAQPKGQDAEFSDIVISENAWNTTLYSDPDTHKIKGTGKPVMWQPNGEIGAPMLRKTIEIAKPIKQARLYSTARGVYEFEINSQKVGNDYLNPGWTDFRKRIMYNTFDVTPLLKVGKNGIGAFLGKGWFTDYIGFNPGWADQYGVQPSLMAMLDIEYQDGSKETIVTDGSWSCNDYGPILENSLFSGEDYDARREIADWTAADFNDAEWGKAIEIKAPAQTVIIQGYVGLPIRNNLTLTSQSVKKIGPKEYIYDMGQNLAGIPRIEGMKGNPGDTVVLHFAEMLYPDIIPVDPVPPYTVEMYKEKAGQLYRENYRSALSTDRYILNGDKSGESYEPRFTYHGYRYISVKGLDYPLPLESVKAKVLESIGDQTSSFETSNPDVNRLFSNAVWGQRGNFLAVPTDCPQRDERMGWTGDAQVFARAATYNMNIDPFYTRWLHSVRDDQNANGSFDGYYPLVGPPSTGGASRYGNMPCGGWMEAGVIVPWQMYQQYGDKGILEEMYPSMARFIDYLERNAVDYIQPFGGTGDWLAPVNTNTTLTNTCYAAYAADLMSKIAEVLGKDVDAKRYAAFFNNTKKAFNKVFINADGMTVVPDEMNPVMNDFAGIADPTIKELPRKDNAGNTIVDTQTSYVLPLQFGLIEDNMKGKVVENLRNALKRSDYTLTTGFVGTPYICLVLSDNGLKDDAYRLFTQDQYPSWLFPVKQGATTFWERWNSYTIENGFGPVSMNSFNHYSYGAIEEWMMSHCLGIQRDEEMPGYKHFLIQPEIGRQLEFAKGGFETMYGPVESAWEKSGDNVVYTLTIPANTTATVKLPGKSVKVLEGSKRMTEIKDNSPFEVGSGKYKFEFKL